MFRRRLSLVLILLAATIVVQAVAAVFALREAERQVVRGRIASDIHQGFVQLSATKQRLRSWVTQHKIGAGGDPQERDALLKGMRATLDELQRLSRAAVEAQLGVANANEQRSRLDALAVLEESVDALVAAIGRVQPLPPDLAAREAWDAMAGLFDRSGRYDLRELIAESIARETTAVQRERASADTTLARMRALWIGMALVLALIALGATVYFGQALRRPLDALVRGAQALRQGQLGHRVPLQGRDEFSDVARSMNAMAEELEQHRQRDLAQRHQLEAQVRARTLALHDANESLERTDLRRRQLLADISHELRTPTTAIRGEAEVTLRGQHRAPGEYREALQRIVETSRQLGAVIDDLLAMARSDMETLSLVRVPLDLHTALQDALGRAGALAAQDGIGIRCELAEAGPLMVRGDAQRLSQLLLLLLDNAVRYSHPGGEVQVSVQAGASDTPWIELRVLDQGIGIPPEELPQVFERHFRGSAARRHRAAGSGLGLPIARALAEAHGGSLVLSSPAGPAGTGGTCALLSLPRLSAAEANDLLGPATPEPPQNQAAA
jgi:two-component system OmpR family sensor kinase